MKKLKFELNEEGLGQVKLMPGKEYLNIKEKWIGMFIRRGGTHDVFVVTTSGKYVDYSMDLSDIPFYRGLASSYIKITDNSKIISTYRRDGKNNVLPIYLDEYKDNTSKPLYSERVKEILSIIKKTSLKTSPEYKITNFLLQKFPSGMSPIEDLGLIHADGDKDDAAIFSINRRSAEKFIRKVSKLTREQSSNPLTLINILSANTVQIKIGKVIKALVGEAFTGREIESFVNTFKSHLLDISEIRISVVKGKDISKYYNGKIYSTAQVGPLQKSCMKDATLHKQWRFYELHPKCELLIMVQNNKLQARALLWTLSDGSKYLDRIYYTYDTQEKMMLKWAKDSGITKNHYDSHQNSHVLLVETDLKKMLASTTEEVTFPYFDSFTGILNNLKYLVTAARNNKFDETKEHLLAIRYRGPSLSRGNSLQSLTTIKYDGLRQLIGMPDENVVVMLNPYGSMAVPETEAVFSKKLGRYIKKADAKNYGKEGWNWDEKKDALGKVSSMTVTAGTTTITLPTTTTAFTLTTGQGHGMLAQIQNGTEDNDNPF